jgi:galactoside O-acetyltransferase
MNFKSIGKNVKISPVARFYNPENIEIGDNVRIDDFCILSGGSGIKIGSHIHIACYSIFFGAGGIVLEDFSQFAVRTTVLSGSDDFLGASLVGPCIPRKFKPNLKEAPVLIKRHVLFGVGCTVFPGVTMGEGVSLGSHTLVIKDCDPWYVYYGTPAKKGKERSKEMLSLEKQFLKEYQQ